MSVIGPGYDGARKSPPRGSRGAFGVEGLQPCRHGRNDNVARMQLTVRSNVERLLVTSPSTGMNRVSQTAALTFDVSASFAEFGAGPCLVWIVVIYLCLKPNGIQREIAHETFIVASMPLGLTYIL